MVRWTPEVDQVLLLLLLDTHDFKINYATLSQNWPAHMDKPSAKAITERIGRIRKDVKTRTGSALPKTPSKPKSAGPSPRTSTKKTSAASSAANKKRKLDDDSDTECPSRPARIPAREARDLQTSSASLFGPAAAPKKADGALGAGFEDVSGVRPKRALSAGVPSYVKEEEEEFDDEADLKRLIENDDSGTEYNEPGDRLHLFEF